MYTLNLETLSEDRLRKAVDPDTFRAGQAIYSQGVVEVVESSDTSALCMVPDKRNYRVEIKVGREHVYLKCSCSHAGRGLICEHDVAAWLTLRDLYQAQLPSPWQNQLSAVISDAQNASLRGKITPYLLFFGLQQDIHQVSSDWTIIPFTLAHSSLPAELREREQVPSEAELLALFKARPETAALRPKSMYSFIEPHGCLNQPLEAINLANLLVERGKTFAYNTRTRFPVNSYLSLLRSLGSPLFLGTYSNPLQRLLTLPASLAEVRLNIARTADGLQITPHIVAGETEIPFDPDLIFLIEPDPPWLQIGNYLVELASPAGLSVLMQFAEEDDELVVPEQQESDFIEQYLLPL
ncbi:MAG: SWIM zinc finger domain-containing protein, partial [Chloroflexota bacterium]